VDGAEQISSLAIDVDSAPLKNIRLQAIPSVVITGSVGTEETPAVSSVRLRRKDGLIPALTADIQNGTFLFPIVPAGEYSLSFPANPQAYVASVSIGNKVFDGDTFQTVGQPLTELQIHVGRPALSLHGLVEQSQSQTSKADVVAISEQTGTIYHVTTDSQRRFAIAGLSPGNYHVFAWPVSTNAPYRVPSYLMKNKDKATEVDLSTSSAASDLLLSTTE